MTSATLPPFIGIRIKPFTEELPRSIGHSTFLTSLLKAPGTLPANSSNASKSHDTRSGHGSRDLSGIGTLARDFACRSDGIMIEQPINYQPSSECNLPCVTKLHADARSAAPWHLRVHRERQIQQRTRPAPSACAIAKHMMQVAFGGTGVWLSDCATTQPVPATEQRNARSDTRAKWKPRYIHRACSSFEHRRLPSQRFYMGVIYTLHSSLRDMQPSIRSF